MVIVYNPTVCVHFSGEDGATSVCTNGTYFEPKDKKCIPCKVGQYQEPGMDEECFVCLGENKTTDGTGAYGYEKDVCKSKTLVFNLLC